MSNDQLTRLRHTTEHVLHAAMQNLFPKLKKAMGPATSDGFYFDFDLNQKITQKDFPKITKQMHKLINLNLPLTQEFISPKKARQIFKNNPYKLEWVNEAQKKGQKISIYKMGDKDLDLCSGPHLKSTSEIKAFKLLSVAGAYWRGDEKNKMLTRIYGTAFPNKKELKKHLELLQEAKKRDHRKLGKDLNLFVFSDLVGKGLPLLTPKGAVIRRELERFIVDEELKRGYQHVYTPPLAKTDLYKTSGHYPYYKDTMYPPMKIDDEELILRPMTCPHHFMLYNSEPKSYRQLPIRYAEISPQFRYEKSGELSGLMRVRTFCLADAHIITSKKDAQSEITAVLDLIDFINKILGMKKGFDYRYRLSLGDRKNTKKYYQDDKAWDHAEQTLRKVLVSSKAPFYEAQNEAAFYGPKIDIQIKNISGKEETAFTVQYDFVMPKRFKMEYIDQNGKKQEPVVIHRSSIGAFERTMAFLIEHFAGAFPVWLSPVQTVIIPISQKHILYANKVTKKLKGNNIRVEIDAQALSMQKRIRNAQLQKVPYILIVGDKEKSDNSVNVRTRGKKDHSTIPLNKFLDQITYKIESKEII